MVDGVGDAVAGVGVGDAVAASVAIIPTSKHLESFKTFQMLEQKKTRPGKAVIYYQSKYTKPYSISL